MQSVPSRSSHTARFLVAGFLLLGSSLAGAQESKALFDAAVIAVPDPFRRISLVMNLDGDGFPDAIGDWQTTSSALVVYGFVNDTHGKYHVVWTVTHATSTANNVDRPLAVGDLNGNGRDDFVVSVGSTIHVYLTHSTASPTRSQMLSSSTQILDLVMADFDGDGRDDLAALEVNAIALYRNIGGTLVLWSRRFVPPGSTDIEPAEVNGDGQTDIVSSGGAVLGLLASDGTSFSLTGSFSPDPALGPFKAVAGDVDGDGDRDIALFGKTGMYALLRHTEATSFAMETTTTGGPATNFADVDGDGDLDGVCCGGGGGGSFINNAVSIFRVALNDGGGTFAKAFEIPGLGAEHLAGVVDVDGDGDLDLVAGRAVYFARGPLSTSPIPPIDPAIVVSDQLTDVDGDDDPDLQYRIDGYEANGGDGSFSTLMPVLGPPELPSGQYVGPGIAGDFDGDGDPDLLVEIWIGGAFSTMELLANNGAGGLHDAGPATAHGVRIEPVAGFSAVANPAGALVADVDGDGDLDLIAHTTEDQSTGEHSRLWINDGNGFFTAGTQPLAEIVRAVADFTGDGMPDLLVVLANSLRLRTGLGNDLFGDPVYLLSNVNGFHDRFQLSDLGHDGDLDVLVIGTFGFGNVGLFGLLNNGDGTFFRLQMIPQWISSASSTVVHAVFALDLNQDGALDFVLSESSSTSSSAAASSVFINNGGSTASGFDFMTDQIFQPLAMADVDGDGDQDLISHAVLKNPDFSGPNSGKRVQFGTGSPGSAGQRPILGAAGPFRAGSAMELRLTGALGGSSGLLLVGPSRAELVDRPRVGLVLYVFPLSIVVALPLGGSPGAPGEGHLTLPVVVPPAVIGLTFDHQFLTFDNGVSPGGAVSNGLEITYGS